MTKWIFLLLLFLVTTAVAQGTFPGVNPIFNGTTTVSGTTSWFNSNSPPAHVLYYGDRLFGGDTINNPNTATTAANIFSATCSTGDWFSKFQATTSNTACGYWPVFSLFVASKDTTTSLTSLNPSSGILGAGQTKDNNFGGAFGVAGFALNNNASAGSGGPAGAGGGWGGYFECDQTVSAVVGCFGAELEAGNFVNDAFSLVGGNPPDPFAQAKVNALQLGCGSGLATPTPHLCAAAAQIVAVGNQFRVGINVLNGSILTQTIFGAPESAAITLPVNYGIVWYSAAGTIVGGITVDASGNMLLAATGSLKFNGTTITIP